MDDAKDVATLPDPARKAATETGDGADAPLVQEEAPDARTEAEEAVDAPTEPDEGEGPEEDARTDEAPQEDVETEEAVTPNDIGSPPQGLHDSNDGPKAPRSKRCPPKQRTSNKLSKRSQRSPSRRRFQIMPVKGR